MRAESGKREQLSPASNTFPSRLALQRGKAKPPARMTEESADVPKELLGKHVRFLSLFPLRGNDGHRSAGDWKGGGGRRRRSRFPTAIPR